MKLWNLLTRKCMITVLSRLWIALAIITLIFVYFYPLFLTVLIVKTSYVQLGFQLNYRFTVRSVLYFYFSLQRFRSMWCTVTSKTTSFQRKIVDKAAIAEISEACYVNDTYNWSDFAVKKFLAWNNKFGWSPSFTTKIS